MLFASTRARIVFLSMLAAGALPACGQGSAPAAVGEAVSADQADPDPGVELRGRGSFSCDFGLTSSLPLSQAAAVIDRDRMFMAARPGLITKHLPIVLDPSTGNFFSGGRYLFDTFDHAKAYDDFVKHGFVLDGVEFLSRPYFVSPACYPWRVVGARAFASIEHQVVMRTERFQVPDGGGNLEGVYHAAREQAEARGFTAVWLVANDDLGLAQLVYYIDRVDPPDPTAPDFASLEALAGAPPLGDTVAPAGWTRVFDRTHWILTDWFHFEPGDTGRPALWPYSPPFPQPACGDGVCQPSRGETGTSCPADCSPHCGDAVCQPAEGETQDSCPSDCRL
jgi:hypothetical protein